MALLTFSGLGVTEASGKIGNKVIQRNRGGYISREWVIPTNTITDSREDVWQAMTIASQLWSILDDNERVLWNQDAINYPRVNRLGAPFILSGFNHFVAAMFGFAINQVIPSMFPPPFARPINPQSITFGTVTTTAIPITFTLTNGATSSPANQSALIFASECVSPGIMYKKSNIPAIAIALPTETMTGDLIGTYTARFGAPIAGKKIYWKVRCYSGISGAPSPFLQTSVIVQ